MFDILVFADFIPDLTCLPLCVRGLVFAHLKCQPEAYFDIALRLNPIRSLFAIMGVPPDAQRLSQVIEKFISNLRSGKTVAESCSDCIELQIVGIPWVKMRSLKK